MASSLPSSFAIILPCSFQPCTRQAFQVRAQSRRDGGRSSNGVDANLSVLRERIKQVKIKEKLERCSKSCDNYGWNYSSGYDYTMKRERDISEFFELVRLVGTTLGFTCFTGTAFLCLVSIFVHFISMLI